MAQALYGEHPLDDYLRESGDLPDRVPGAYTDSLEDDREVEDIIVDSDAQWKRSSVATAAEAFRKWTLPIRGLLPTPNHDFAERFKYDLISSNLLSTSVATTPVLSHSRTRSLSPDPSLPGKLQIPKQDVVEKSKQELKSLSSAFVFVGLAALLNQYRVAAALAMFTSLTVAKSTESTSTNKDYIPRMFDTLESLKAAGTLWDSLVNDAVTTLEQEERSSSFISSSLGTPPSPSSALRIALHSTLLTTQNQCDNVRPLLAALASPLELSQLAEMYAPSSPLKPSFSLQTRTTPRHGRVSLSENAITGLLSVPHTPLSEKRRTWNGANTQLADISSRTSTILHKRDRRRSDMFSLLESQKSPPRTTSVQTSPRSSTLTQVPEVDEDMDDGPADGLDVSEDSFGTAALFLRRKRRSRALSVLGLSASRSVPALRDSHLSPPPSLSSSRFTSMQSSRHPLSMSALHHALQGALSARRYACAHLLALRFDEDVDDESYWENVRSVIGLLTSALEDGAARLSDALEESDRLKGEESRPSPSPSPCPTPGCEAVDLTFSAVMDREDRSTHQTSKYRPNLNVLTKGRRPMSPLGTLSFAPVPTALGRFASHLESVSSAVDDVRENVEECLTTLRKQELNVPSSTDQIENDELVILQAYERLRKELGLALRECERGKAALSDVFEARRKRVRPVVDQENEEEIVQHETINGSADSDDKHDVEPYTPNDGSPVLPSLPSLESILAGHYHISNISKENADVDDVTEHLLASSSSSHLPPPGIEQVYEAEVIGNERFNRERAKLSREERILLMKSKRASIGLSTIPEDSSEAAARRARMGWGPAPDVVEELKDVIWKVGEQRRRLFSSQESSPSDALLRTVPISTSSSPSPSDHLNEYVLEALPDPISHSPC